MRAAVFTALLQFKRLENLCQGALNLEEKKIIMELQSHDRLSCTRESVVTGKGVRKATAQIPKNVWNELSDHRGLKMYYH